MNQLAPPSDPGATSLVEAMRFWATVRGAAPACVFVADEPEDEEVLTFAELDRRARAVAATLQKTLRPGDRALLIFSPGPEHVVAFYGCLYAGVIAVVCPLPSPRRPEGPAATIARDCSPGAVLTTSELASLLQSRLENALPDESVRWIEVDRVDPGVASGWLAPELSPMYMSHLQYTSGSTSTPRGVEITHGNLIHNSHLLCRAFSVNLDTMVSVSWLPLQHDMGLVGWLTSVVYFGVTSHLIPPVEFVQRPVRWLKAITRFGGTYSTAPNFAFDLCVSRISDEQLEGLDLSSWITAGNGSEPVRPETLARFAERFAPVGFRPEALFPCYGLAEATLIVSGGPSREPPVIRAVDAEALENRRVQWADEGSPGSRVIASSGEALTGQGPCIVDPETHRTCESGGVGEIWVTGPSVATGYWQKDAETKLTFGAIIQGSDDGKRYLRTGDLGFIEDGQLYITGRLKDLIILQGRNHFPQDIETTVESCHPSLPVAGGGAFSIEEDGLERLVVVHEVTRAAVRSVDEAEVIAVMRQAVAEEHGVRLEHVVLVWPGTIPKTTSGKIQRFQCKAQYLAGTLRRVGKD